MLEIENTHIILCILETPLTVAVKLAKPKPLIMALVAGGAHLDYRAADSYTPLHRAAIHGNFEAIKVCCLLFFPPLNDHQ